MLQLHFYCGAGARRDGTTIISVVSGRVSKGKRIDKKKLTTTIILQSLCAKNPNSNGVNWKTNTHVSVWKSNHRILLMKILLLLRRYRLGTSSVHSTIYHAINRLWKWFPCSDHQSDLNIVHKHAISIKCSRTIDKCQKIEFNHKWNTPQ